MPASNQDEGTVRTTVTIPKTDYDSVERIAREKRVSVAWVVREALAEYLTQSDDAEPKAVGKKGARR